MKESDRKEVANHPDPASCDDAREGIIEALTGAHAGMEMELRNNAQPGADADIRSGGQNQDVRKSEHGLNSAQSKTHRMYGNSLCKNWERSLFAADGTAVRAGKGNSRTTAMNDDEHSDFLIVPTKSSNKVSTALTAERMEGRREQPRETRKNVVRTGHRAGNACHRG